MPSCPAGSCVGPICSASRPSRPMPPPRAISRAPRSPRSPVGPNTWCGASTTRTVSSSTCPKRDGSTSKTRPRRRSRGVPWPASSSARARAASTGRASDPGARVRHTAQGLVVGARARRRRPPRRSWSRTRKRRVCRLHPDQQLQASPHDRPARPAHGVGHRTRLGRRHPAAGQALAVRFARFPRARAARGAAQCSGRGPRGGARTRAPATRRPLRVGASAAASKCTGASASPVRRAAPTSSGCRSNRTRWPTARPARRAARFWPTVVSPACSSNPRGPAHPPRSVGAPL